MVLGCYCAANQNIQLTAAKPMRPSTSLPENFVRLGGRDDMVLTYRYGWRSSN
jgi:hypothetical protein